MSKKAATAPSSGQIAYQKRVYEQELERRITQNTRWRYTGGWLYNLLYFLFWLSAIYVFLLNSAHILALALRLQNDLAKYKSGMVSEYGTEEAFQAATSFYRSHLVFLVLLTFLFIAAVILLIKKHRFSAMICAWISIGFTFLLNLRLISSEYAVIEQNALFVLLYVFMFLIPLLALGLWLIAWLDQKALDRAYNAAIEKEYRRQSEHDAILSELDWDLALEHLEQKQAPPVGRRHRKQSDTYNTQE